MKTDTHLIKQIKEDIRRKIRAKRKLLTIDEQKKLALALAEILVNEPLFIQSETIAGYIANEGEQNLFFLMLRAWQLGKQWFLPVLQTYDPETYLHDKLPEKDERLKFVEYKHNDPLKKNCFGIPEPILQIPEVREFQTSKEILFNLDLVFMPLVAFDTQGRRLGMGAGYYDRTFQFLKEENIETNIGENIGEKIETNIKDHNQIKKPILIGVAYEFQQVDALPEENWDVPLDGIATEQKLTFFHDHKNKR